MITVLLNAIVGLGAWLLKKLDRKLFPLVLMVTCSIVDECVAHYFKVKFRNNLMVYYVSAPFEYAFLAWFLHLNIENSFVKKIIKLSIWVNFIVTIAFLFSYANYAYNNFYLADLVGNYFIIAKGLLVSVFCICYFKNIFDRIANYEYLDVYVMLVVSGMLFYYAFSTVYFAAENYLTTQALNENANFIADVYKSQLKAMSQAYRQLKDIQIFLYLTNILFYLCILVAFFKKAFGAKEPVLLENSALRFR